MSETPGQQTRQPGLQKLLEPGETEPRLEVFLSSLDGDFSDGTVVPPLQDKRCALCTIPDYPYSKGEIVLKDTENFYIVETENMKGHDRRNMLVLNDHHSLPSDEEFSGYALEGLESLVDYTARGESGSVVVYAGNTTFHHPHVIASDLEPEDADAAKLSEVNNYLVFDDPDSIADPSHEHYGDVVGEAFLERFYRCAVRDL